MNFTSYDNVGMLFGFELECIKRDAFSSTPLDMTSFDALCESLDLDPREQDLLDRNIRDAMGASFDDGGVTVADYLSATGYKTCEDIMAHVLGYSPTSEFDVVIGEMIADELAHIIGPNILVSGEHGAVRRDDFWTIELDQSILPTKFGDMGLEIVSPPMPPAQAFRVLSELLTYLSENGYYVNESCGLHINLSTSRELRPTAVLVNFADIKTLELFDRSSNVHCYSQERELLDIEHRQTYDLIDYVTLRLIHDHQASIDFRDGYMEFRHIGGPKMFADKFLVKSVVMQMLDCMVTAHHMTDTVLVDQLITVLTRPR